MKRASILSVCMVALAAFLAWAPNAVAFEAYSDGCTNCHSSTVHGDHRTVILSSDCNACHVPSGRRPVFLNRSAGGNGLAPIGCVGCHGRAEDRFSGDATGNNPPSGDGAGLRRHHWNAGETGCVNCHDDSDPASNFVPVGENVLPPFYANPGANHPNIPRDPCSPNGEEEFGYNFASAPGLDNDGDGVYGPVDSDCVQAGPCDGFVAEPTACGVGECSSTGTSTCTEVNGEAVFGDTCTPSAGSTEICDGLDNDCDGTPDDGIADMFTGTDVGECRPEVRSCTGGSFQVVQSGIGSQPEVCDGLDNDCDGQVDNGIAATPTTCGTGDCAAIGQVACVDGSMVDDCAQGTPSDETCDQRDNNCNGAIDEGGVCVTVGACDNFTPTSTACGTGECVAAGMTTCTDVGGAAIIGDTCAPGTPISEICDGLDNDCDGTADEGGVCAPPPGACDGFTAETTACGTGECAASGITTCTDVGGAAIVGDTCLPGPPMDEVCGNGTDENCNGMADDVCGTCPTGGAVTIKEIEYNAGDKKLAVKGLSTSGSTVTISNADTGEVLADGVDARGGEWEIVIRNLETDEVPARILVQTDDGCSAESAIVISGQRGEDEHEDDERPRTKTERRGRR